MSAINAVVDLTNEGEVAVLTVNSPPVNALSLPVRMGLKEGAEKAFADPSVKAVVLICEGRTFVAGADITEFAKPRANPTLREVNDVLADAPKPLISATHGTVLGGGVELTLVSDYRIAAPSTRFGFPEVKIGIIPASAGSQLLPRLIGPEKAVEMMALGEQISAKTALEIGLIDEIVQEGDLRAQAIAYARKVIAEGRPLRKLRDENAKVDAVRGKPEIFAAFRKANARKFRGQPAHEANIRLVEAAVNLPYDQGVDKEWEFFADLISGPESKALRYAFFAEREAWKVPDVPADTPTIPINKAGVIGAGTMGGGIAMNFANVGIPVIIVEQQQEALDRGLGVIRRNYENTAKRGRLTMEDVEKRMGLITGTLALGDLKDVDIVIEAVFENMEIKKEIFAKLDGIVKQGAILASNTSFLDVDEIASATKRPQDVIGLHFFSPANVMKLLEIVRGEKTSKSVIATSMKLGKTIGKIAALSRVCPGFIGNRMLAPRQREAQALVMNGAMPWQIDKALYDFGFPMGPFAMSDLAGLDIGWNKETSKGETLRDVLCEMDRRGQKNGKGFYDYDENRNAIPSPITEKIIQDFRAKAGVTPRDFSDQEILERTLYPLINEGAKILEEGVAIRPSDIDIVWLYGYGWPSYRGGPMHYADSVGLKTIVEKLKGFQAEFGDAFKPSALLERLAAEGKGFADL